MSDYFEDLVARLQMEVKMQLEQQHGELSDRELNALIEDRVFFLTKENYVSIPEKRRLVQRIYNSFRGLDVLQPCWRTRL